MPSYVVTTPTSSSVNFVGMAEMFFCRISSLYPVDFIGVPFIGSFTGAKTKQRIYRTKQRIYRTKQRM
jgi:hypothetical protein